MSASQCHRGAITHCTPPDDLDALSARQLIHHLGFIVIHELACLHAKRPITYQILTCIAYLTKVFQPTAVGDLPVLFVSINHSRLTMRLRRHGNIVSLLQLSRLQQRFLYQPPPILLIQQRGINQSSSKTRFYTTISIPKMAEEQFKLIYTVEGSYSLGGHP